eukprot:3074393-Rhodomonas_salina.1
MGRGPERSALSRDLHRLPPDPPPALHVPGRRQWAVPRHGWRGPDARGQLRGAHGQPAGAFR